MGPNREALLAQVFAEFPDERVMQEARKVLEAMEYTVQQDGLCCVIPRAVLLAVVQRSLHSDVRLRSGGYLAFEVAVGPHFTAEGMFSGVCDYGLLRLEFGLDGTFQDDFFTISPILAPSEMEWEYEQAPGVRVLAEDQTQYGEKTERGNS